MKKYGTNDDMIQKRFGLDIPVFVILQEKLEDILSKAPDWWVRIPLDRNSLHASAGRLSAPNGKFFKLHWITHVLAI